MVKKKLLGTGYSICMIHNCIQTSSYILPNAKETVCADAEIDRQLEKLNYKIVGTVFCKNKNTHFSMVVHAFYFAACRHKPDFSTV